MDKAALSQLFAEASRQAGQLSDVFHKFADFGLSNETDRQRLWGEYVEAKDALNAVLVEILEEFPEVSGGTDQPEPVPAPEPALDVATDVADADVARRPIGRFNGLELFVNPEGQAARAAANATDPYERRVFDYYARQPVAFWYGGWGGAVDGLRRAAEMARQQNQVLVVVLYNIPGRDASGGYSAGGTSYTDYPQWLQRGVEAVGNTPTVWIVEPDALADLGALSADRQVQRRSLIAEAVRTLKSASPDYWVYIDAGNSSWQSPETMADRLRSSGIDLADGFACNISNFQWHDQTLAWCFRLSDLLGGKHFVVDTSRNGNGPWTNPAGPEGDDWCNPPGRLLGYEPSVQPLARCDGYLWVKPAGESDGNCKGGPNAGEWFPQYALELAREVVSR